MSYKIFNKTYQSLRLTSAIILPRKFIIVKEVTQQMKVLDSRGLLFIKKIKQ